MGIERMSLVTLSIYEDTRIMSHAKQRRVVDIGVSYRRRIVGTIRNKQFHITDKLKGNLLIYSVH